ncbi:hypothetical protein FDECE_6857 [Fusarium decemcellulare]|nr:hypothetical protein FDECE_6857 [Fusarium decemcellulare]
MSASAPPTLPPKVSNNHVALEPDAEQGHFLINQPGHQASTAFPEPGPTGFGLHQARQTSLIADAGLTSVSTSLGPEEDAVGVQTKVLLGSCASLGEVNGPLLEKNAICPTASGGCGSHGADLELPVDMLHRPAAHRIDHERKDYKKTLRDPDPMAHDPLGHQCRTQTKPRHRHISDGSSNLSRVRVGHNNHIVRWQRDTILKFSVDLDSFPYDNDGLYVLECFEKAIMTYPVVVHFKYVTFDEPATFVICYRPTPDDGDCQTYAEAFLPSFAPENRKLEVYALALKYRHCMVNILAHEIGHILGLRHEFHDIGHPSVQIGLEDRNSVMNYRSSNDLELMEVSQQDVDGLRRLYDISGIYKGHLVSEADPRPIRHGSRPSDQVALGPRGIATFPGLREGATGPSNSAIEEYLCPRKLLYVSLFCCVFYLVGSRTFGLGLKR